MKKSNQIIGKKGEDYAVHFLISNGYEILDRNYHSKYGEIDIVASKNSIISFIEVKTRSNDRFGSPEESISFQKASRMKKTIFTYLQEKKLNCEFQIDIIAILINSFEEVQLIRHYMNVELL